MDSLKTDAAGSDTTGSDSPVPAAHAPEMQGTPSRCIPFTRVEPKPSAPGNKKD
jgi:hypothetical protein